MSVRNGERPPPRPPSVLLVGPGFSGGGAEGHFRALAERGFGGQASVLVIHEGRSRAVPGPFSGLRSWLALKVRYLELVLRIRSRLRAGRVGAVAGFGCFPNLIVMLAASSLVRRPRVVLFEITRPEQAARVARMAWLVKMLQRLCYPRADRVVCNSIDGAAECERYLGVDGARTAVVPCLLDIESIAQQSADDPEWTPPAGRAVAAYHGRLIRSKRVDLLLRAVEAMPRDRRPLLLVIGTGPEEAGLRSWVERHGLEEDVAFVGWSNRPASLLRSASLYLFASEYEGFSNSVLEALALGLPVFTSDWGADARALAARGAVRLISPEDTQQTAATISCALADPEGLRQLGARGRTACEWHEVRAALPRYEALISGSEARSHAGTRAVADPSAILRGPGKQ
jgi:glycosyltransferase involved in cell wall biosynthesis